MRIFLPLAQILLNLSRRRSAVLLVSAASLSMLMSFLAGCSGGVQVTTIAGTGVEGYTDDGGSAALATFSSVTGIAVDAAGNLYVADGGNSVIRKITASNNVISTIAGTGVQGYAGDGGPAAKALLRGPWGLTLDAADTNLYIADRDNDVVRKMNLATGVITTIAGTGVEDSTGDGGKATLATLDLPEGVAVDSKGDVYIGETGGSRVRKVTTATGIITTVAGGGKSLADGVQATAENIQPDGILLDGDDTLLIGDRSRESVVKVDLTAGLLTTVAGDGMYGSSGNNGAANQAELSTPSGLTLSASGDLFIASFADGTIRKVGAMTNTISLVVSFAGSSAYQGQTAPTALAIDKEGSLYVADFTARVVRKVTGAQ